MLELGVASVLMIILGFPASRPRLSAGLRHPFVLVGILDGLNVGLLEAGACGQRAHMTAQLISGLVTFISVEVAELLPSASCLCGVVSAAVIDKSGHKNPTSGAVMAISAMKENVTHEVACVHVRQV